MQTIKIDIRNNGIRIDHFLKKTFPHMAKSEIHKRIRKKEVKINNKKAKFFDVLKEGDEITVYFSLRPNFKILYEDDDLLVIDKPVGVCVVKEDFHQERVTVQDLFPDYYPIHRIDRDTSGVLLIAKNKKALDFFQNQFRDRVVKKSYIALVLGVLEPEEGAIEAPIGRQVRERNKMGIVGVSKKRYALTRYKMIKNCRLQISDLKFQECSLIKVNIITGRTHQIRVHFKAIGHPVIGDSDYGSKKINKIFKEKLGLTRQFLHAEKLAITLPSGVYKEFESNLPKDLEKCLKEI